MYLHTFSLLALSSGDPVQIKGCSDRRTNKPLVASDLCYGVRNGSLTFPSFPGPAAEVVCEALTAIGEKCPEALQSAVPTVLACLNKWTTSGLGSHSIQVGLGSHSLQVGLGSHSVQVGLGSHSIQVGLGSHSIQVGFGSHSVQVGLGSHSMKVGLGNHSG